jgi:hypothetical protein
MKKLTKKQLNDLIKQMTKEQINTLLGVIYGNH